MIKFNDTTPNKVILDSIKMYETFIGTIDGWKDKTGPFLKINGAKETGGLQWHIVRLREPSCVWSESGYKNTIITNLKYVDLEIREL